MTNKYHACLCPCGQCSTWGVWMHVDDLPSSIVFISDKEREACLIAAVLNAGEHTVATAAMIAKDHALFNSSEADKLDEIAKCRGMTN